MSEPAINPLETPWQPREQKRLDQLAQLALQPDHVLDIVCLLARAMAEEQRYVLCVEIPSSSTARVTNFEDDIALARFLERFARAARRDDAC